MVGAVTVRARSFAPTPHVAGQSPHTLHDPTVQSASQRSELHGSASMRYGHGAPLPMAISMTACAREEVPEPHVCKHAPHSPQASTAQSTAGQISFTQHVYLELCLLVFSNRCVPGQANSLHLVSSVVVGQTSPVVTVSVVTERLRYTVPPPQVSEHSPHTTQLLTTQSAQATIHV